MNRAPSRQLVLLLALSLAAVSSPALSAYSSGFHWTGAAPTPSSAAPPPSAIPVPQVVHPAFTCPNPPLTFGGVNGVWAISPSLPNQVPCTKLSVDEVHATFNSATAGSGERFTIPVHLPHDGSAFQDRAYSQFMVGMVVKGDFFSQWKQSYAGAVFTPIGEPVSSYSMSLHVFALENSSLTGGACDTTSWTLVWNSSFFCESDLLATDTNITASFLAGDLLDITMSGSTSGTDGLGVWINDTTTPLESFTTTLNQTTTGTYTIEPFYSASCVDTCMLQWSFPFGLGISFTNCPEGAAAFATCDSYNDTTWSGTHPVEFGIPHFFAGGGYSGDYYYFAPESTSGACNFNAPPNTESFCFNQDSLGGTGFYPYFTYNGSLLDFGINWTWTTQNWGGPLFEFYSTAAQHDLVPFYFYRLTNDSRAGFVASGGTVTVTAHLQDLGSVSYAAVTYQVNSGAAASLAMSRVNGTLSDGNWSATIPSGANGWVNYTVNATNHAGAPLVSLPYHLQRGPLPTFSLPVVSTLVQCGGVNINGVLYASGSTVSINPGIYPIHAVGCYPYVFSTWTLPRGVSVSPFNAQDGTITISAGGTITAKFTYVRPFDTIQVFTNPSICGQAVVNGSFFSSGQTFQLLDQGNYSLGDIGCGGYSFAGWTFTGGNFTILGTNFYLHGNGTLTANFVSSTSAFTIVFHVTPSSCGGVLFQGAGYTDGQSLAVLAGTYAIDGDPCYHWGLWYLNTTGSLSITGTTLTVSGSGAIYETDYVLTIVTFVTSPAFCGTIIFDGVTYVNGQTLVVTNDTTHSVSATSCPGYYLFSLVGTFEGPWGINVIGNLANITGSGEIIATSIPGTPTTNVAFLTDPPTCGTITFGGGTYVNSNFTTVAQGTVVAISAHACNQYGFVKWLSYGGVVVWGPNAYLNSSGALEAIFRPLATVFIFTQPGNCGSVTIANITYPNNYSATLTEDRGYPISVSACPGYGFANWVNTSGAQLIGGNLTLTSGSVLTAVFAPVRYDVTVIVNPSVCGGVRVAGTTVGNGTVLSLGQGTFTIYPEPCVGDHLVRWDVSGNLSVTNTTLWVNSSGSVSAVYQPVPPSVTLYVPTSSFSGVAVPLGATVAVPVPPYTYTFSWDFGDQGSVSTPVNFTSHTYANPGTYQVKLTVTDPFNRTANASATISVIQPTSQDTGQFTPQSEAAIIIAIVAVALVVLIGTRWRRGPPTSPDELATPASPTGPDEPMPSDAPLMEAPKP